MSEEFIELHRNIERLKERYQWLLMAYKIFDGIIQASAPNVIGSEKRRKTLML